MKTGIRSTTTVPEAQEDAENHRVRVTETEVMMKETEDITTTGGVRKDSQTERSGEAKSGLDVDVEPLGQAEKDDLHQTRLKRRIIATDHQHE